MKMKCCGPFSWKMRTAYNPSREIYTFHALTSQNSFIVIYSGKWKNWGTRLISNCFTETSARRKIVYLSLKAHNTARNEFWGEFIFWVFKDKNRVIFKSNAWCYMQQYVMNYSYTFCVRSFWKVNIMNNRNPNIDSIYKTYICTVWRKYRQDTLNHLFLLLYRILIRYLVSSIQENLSLKES